MPPALFTRCSEARRTARSIISLLVHSWDEQPFDHPANPSECRLRLHNREMVVSSLLEANLALEGDRR